MVVVVDEGEKRERSFLCTFVFDFVVFDLFSWTSSGMAGGWIDIGVRWLPLGSRKRRGVFCLIDTLITVVWSGVEWSGV
jgi:hypothetical protein